MGDADELHFAPLFKQHVVLKVTLHNFQFSKIVRYVTTSICGIGADLTSQKTVIGTNTCGTAIGASLV